MYTRLPTFREAGCFELWLRAAMRNWRDHVRRFEWVHTLLGDRSVRLFAAVSASADANTALYHRASKPAPGLRADFEFEGSLVAF